MQNQSYIFSIFILNGFLIGILFDVFRIFRRSFKTPDFITYIEDILFWILSGCIILYSIFKFNNGELRLFIFIGIIAGVLIYLLLFSKIFINFAVYFIKIIKKIFFILIIIPIKFVIKLTTKPLTFLYLITKNIMSFFVIKAKKVYFQHKIHENKKDFT